MQLCIVIAFLQTVLVAGGSGSVGHYALLTTVSSEAKADHARAAGADVIINYRTENVVERVRTATKGMLLLLLLLLLLLFSASFFCRINTNCQDYVWYENAKLWRVICFLSCTTQVEVLIESSNWILRVTPPSSLNYWPQTAYVSAMVQYECGSKFFTG